MKNKLNKVIYIIFLLILAGISNSIMDTIKFRFYESKLKFISKEWFLPDSWKLKWKWKNNQRILNNKKLWYYLWLYKPQYKEAFPYSTTILVFLTNAWHFFQFIMLSSFQAAISITISMVYCFNWWQFIVIFFIIKIIYNSTFELFWKKILN